MKDYSKMTSVELWGELGKLDAQIDNLVDDVEAVEREILGRPRGEAVICEI